MYIYVNNCKFNSIVDNSIFQFFQTLGFRTNENLFKVDFNISRRSIYKKESESSEVIEER